HKSCSPSSVRGQMSQTIRLAHRHGGRSIPTTITSLPLPSQRTPSSFQVTAICSISRRRCPSTPRRHSWHYLPGGWNERPPPPGPSLADEALRTPLPTQTIQRDNYAGFACRRPTPLQVSTAFRPVGLEGSRSIQLSYRGSSPDFEASEHRRPLRSYVHLVS